MKHQALFSSKDKSKNNKSVVRCNFAWVKVFPNTDWPYHGMKVTCFVKKSMKVLTSEFSAFVNIRLQNNTYNAIGKLNWMKI